MPYIAGRKSTLLFITVLSILSFSVLLAESADVHGWRDISRHRRAIFEGFPAGGAANALGFFSKSLVGNTVVSLSSTSLPPFSSQTPPSPSSVQSSPLQQSTSSASPPSQAAAGSTASSPAASSSSASASAGIVVQMTSASASISASTLISAVSPSSTTSALQAQVSALSSSPGVPENPAPSALSQSPESANDGIPSMTPIASSPSSTSSNSPSSSSFFSNKGAVAGTFTVVGLVGVAGIIGAGMLIARRRSSSRGGYEDDMEYLEKERGPDMHVPRSHSPDGGFTDMDHSGLGHSSSDLQRPPEAHLYPDHGVHMGYAHNTPMDDDPSYYGQDARYSPNTYGIEYPPGEAYGAPHQPTEAYRGGPNPQVEEYGNVTTQFQQAEYGGTFTHQADAHGEMSNPHEPYLYPEPPAVAQPAAAAVPSALRPSVKHKSVMNPFLQSPEQRDPHTSIDSFYGGIVQGNAEPAAF
ncbi:hypothetical protein BV22DRAFT_1027424 [Leucogyrophana mollusca]|uniref:Uncharacterized protein n=1 Tax=Leucogyrophana mollusca TaxID=85980 RepID=A0ACB8C0P6_9AGAM|nr:hypothetical protein BV22DRAFT_1027424 [Leucogyrophana mollusca]